MKMNELFIPEWSFLDATNHLGDLLSGRNLLLHTPSLTILEVLTGIFGLNNEVPSLSFEYVNHMGLAEHHTIAVHRSAIWGDKDDIQEVLTDAVNFYREYLRWEDNNIIIDEGSQHN